MTEVLIFSFLTGAVLGQRFRVLVLLPPTLVMVLAAIPVGLMADVTFLQGLKNLVLAAVALQAGYLSSVRPRLWPCRRSRAPACCSAGQHRSLTSSAGDSRARLRPRRAGSLRGRLSVR